MNKVLRRDPPKSFWLISVVLLIWNGMGVAAYLTQATQSAEDLAATYTPAEIAIIESMPAWVTGAFAIAVFTGLLGVLALLARKAVSRWLFIVSLAAVIIQHIWTFGMSGMLELVSPIRVVMPILVVIICIFQIWYAANGIKRGWLR